MANKLAQVAWDASKQKEDPTYKELREGNLEFALKLDTDAGEMERTGIPGDIAGLEAFEAKCLELVSAAKDKAVKAEKTDTKGGKH